MKLFNRNVFGQIVWMKKYLISILGAVFYRRFHKTNHLKVEGGEVLESLPHRHVLFVSNHQTYFADVTAMLYSMCAARKGKLHRLNSLGYMFNPPANIYFIAARETMKAGILPRIFAYAGAVEIQRTWREAGQEVHRKVNPEDTKNIGIALSDGWVITFPQETTTPDAPGRKGTAHIIRQYRPLVVPIIVDGFRHAFDKKGLKLEHPGTVLSLCYFPPLDIDYDNDSVEAIMEKVMKAIGQYTPRTE